MELLKKIFSVKMSYIAIFLSLVAWSFFAFFTMNELINSQKKFSKLINISGKQRMLSQKTTLMINRVIKTGDHKLFEHLKYLTKKMKEDHLFLVNNLSSENMINIYLKEPMHIDKDVQQYLSLLNQFILEYKTTDNINNLVKNIEEHSFNILSKLDYAVNQFEKESDTNTLNLKNRELFILIGTLFTLIIEIIFIMIPALRFVRESKEKLLNFNSLLKQEVKNKTQELKKSNDLKKFYLNTVNTLIIAFDKNSNITMINQKGCDLLGVKKDELIGKNWFEIGLISQNEVKFVKRFFNKIIRKKIDVSKTSFENTLINKKGEVKVFTWSNALIEENGEVSGILSSGIDITNERKQEFIIKEQAKLASMGEMIGNIAHQWRQPLSLISTSATGMLMQKEFGVLEDNEFKHMCNQINDNAQYLSQTIDDFRNFIRGDSIATKFNLQDTVNRFLLLVHSSIKNNSINPITNIDNRLELNGYPNELIQCLMNFYNNAKDAMIENKIKNQERYIFLSAQQKENKLEILFKDNGGGIPKQIINRVFEPYFTTKLQSHGTGLGLHMTYKMIVDKMKGEIYVSNEEYLFNDKKYIGAVFTILLPFPNS